MSNSFPYFLYRANNMVDFCNIQEKLFEKGYSWYNGDTDVFHPLSKLDKFPLYLSNLPSVEDKPDLEHFWYSTEADDFDIKLLRIEKLKKLNNV